MTLLQSQPRPLAHVRGRGGVMAAWTGSAGDSAAARWALDWAHRTGRPLTVLVSGAAASPGAAYRSDLADALGIPVAMTEPPFLDVVVQPGDPASAVLAAVSDVDVLVLPVDGPAPVAGRSLGRTAETIVARGTTAVVIVPALHRRDPEGTVVVGEDVDPQVLRGLAAHAPVVRTATVEAMIDASRAADLVVARCDGSRDSTTAHRPADCRALQVAASAWSPVLAVHA